MYKYKLVESSDRESWTYTLHTLYTLYTTVSVGYLILNLTIYRGTEKFKIKHKDK